MRHRMVGFPALMAALFGLSGSLGIGAPAVAADTTKAGAVQHVLLISVDGLHAVDLSRYVEAHPGSTLAALSRNGLTYVNAACSRPSDAFPGLVALVTGGTPAVTGIWYDNSYDRKLLPPTVAGGGSAPGTAVLLAENIDYDQNQIDGGASAHGGAAIDPAKLPRDPATGQPVYPHTYLRVNTIFEVAKAAGRYTAWCDKHPAYELVNGLSGTGVDDLFDPEVDAPITDPRSGRTGTPTSALGFCKTYDDVKVRAVLNEVGGRDHTGSHAAPVPAVFGMNFQMVSVGQKLAKDALDSRSGGYRDAAGDPTPVLSDALDYVDSRLGLIVARLRDKGLLASTAIVVTAKHGQAPIDGTSLRKPGDPIASVVGARAAHETTDDVALLWLTDPGTTESVVGDLRAAAAKAGNTLGIGDIRYGNALKQEFDDPRTDSRTPDIVVVPRNGVIYTESKKKIAEHGGFGPDDTHVALLVALPSLRARTITVPVQTTQVAPTILALLGLDPNQLQAVQQQKTAVLPGLPGQK